MTEGLGTAYSELSNRCKRLKSELTALRRDNELLKVSHEKTTQEAGELLVEKICLHDELAALREENGLQKVTIEQLRERIKNADAAYEQRVTELTAVKKELHDINILVWKGREGNDAHAGTRET